jgi:hypothetical protein
LEIKDKMKYTTLDANGLPTAFYSDDIHKNIPTDAIEITDEQWLECINNSGARQFVNGVLIAYVSPITQEQLLKAIEAAIEKHMDEVAQSKKYDNRDSCRLYAGYINPFQSEAIAFGQWVAACWEVVITAQAGIIAGTRTIPTPEAAVLELPVIVW